MERTNRGMLCDPTQCFFEQFFPRRNFVPWGRARGMRQWNHIKAVFPACNPKFARDHFLEFCAVDKLHDSQSAYGNDETRLQNPDLIVHPWRAVADFVRCWNPISSAGILSGKTSADSCEINLRSNGGLIQSAGLFEPAKECLASSMSEWPLQNWLSGTGRLANNHYLAANRAA